MIGKKRIGYDKIIFITVALFFDILFIIFLMSKLFIKIRPYFYQKTRECMNDFNDAMRELKMPLGIIKINL